MTKAITVTAFTCFLVIGAAATSILDRHQLAEVRAETASVAVESPVSNTESKQDRLALATIAPASFEPTPIVVSNEPPPEAVASVTSSIATPPAEVVAPKVAAPVTPPPAPQRPKPANKPPQQKSYALLSDAQIASIKERLRLSSSQEYYWPAVENALRAVARKIHAKRKADPNATGAPIDPEAEEVQQLKSAAMPLLFQLREDQKQEVRSLARLIGLDKVAEQI